MSDAELRDLDRALAAQPDDGELHARRGRLLTRLGRPVEGAGELDLATRLLHLRHDLEGELATLLDSLALRDDALGLDFRLVPGGPFLMGSAEGDEDEKPVHLVRLSPFYVSPLLGYPDHGVAPVVPAGLFPQARRRKKTAVRGPLSVHYRGAASPGFPGNAESIAAAATTLTGTPHRLPTEAEWERVRQGVALGLPYRVEIGQGLEWTRDWYDSTTYDRGRAQDPTGPSTGEMRVVRGRDFELSHAFVGRPSWRDSAFEDGRMDEKESPYPSGHPIAMRLVRAATEAPT